jgi:hypothetical protein
MKNYGAKENTMEEEGRNEGRSSDAMCSIS